MFNPKSIERTSTKFATAVFHESTISALRYYSNDDGCSTRNYNQTAAFIEYIYQYWKIINVRSPTTGRRLRDIFRDPVKSSNDWKLSFLEKFLQFLVDWRSLGIYGLTEETFFALTQSTASFIEFTKYMIDRLGFNYVLLGKVSSDNIEERFGHYRQLSGGNYLVSVRQLLESERKLKLLSVMKFNGAKDFEQHVIDEENGSSVVLNDLSSQIDVEALPEVSEDEMNAIFYVSGYVIKSYLKRKKCKSCDNILKYDDLPLYVNEEYFDDISTVRSENIFLNLMDRGGLCKPSDNTIAITTLCYQVYMMLTETESLKRTFLSVDNHSCIFSSLVLNLSVSKPIITVCEDDHEFVKNIAISMFNTMTKNFVKSMSDQAANNKKKLTKFQ